MNFLTGFIIGVLVPPAFVAAFVLSVMAFGKPEWHPDHDKL